MFRMVRLRRVTESRTAWQSLHASDQHHRLSPAVQLVSALFPASPCCISVGFRVRTS